MCPSNFYKMNNEKKGDYPISTQKYNRRPVHIKNEDNYIITILQYIHNQSIPLCFLQACAAVICHCKSSSSLIIIMKSDLLFLLFCGKLQYSF